MFDGNWFSQKLQAKKLTQRRLAGLLGVHYSRLSRLLNGKLKMTPAEVMAFAKILGVSVEDVVQHADASATRKKIAAADSPSEHLTKRRPAPPKTESKRGLPPFYGSMKGLITIAPGVDLTEPAADPDSWKFRG